MGSLECPHCGFRKFESDWVYNHGLYDSDTTKKVECPSCAETFYVSTWEAIGYTCEKDEEDL